MDWKGQGFRHNSRTGDGHVDIADVNAVINLMLEK